MLFGNNRDQLRRTFFSAWHKHRQGLPLEGIENLIVSIAINHPEYQPILEQPERYRDRDYLPEFGETNPFLHMGMHIAVLEQLSIDQPRGIRAQYELLVKQAGDEHTAQHRVMECLGEAMWNAQRHGGPPSEADYLACLKQFSKQ
jgi:hypothetical protein